MWRCGTLVFLYTFPRVLWGEIRMLFWCAPVGLTLSWGCASWMPTLSVSPVPPCLSFRVSKDLFHYLSFTIFLHHTQAPQCVVCALSARHWPTGNKHLLVRARDSPEPKRLSLYISRFLPLVHPTRGFLGLVFCEVENAVACLGWVELRGGSWGPGGEMGLLAFQQM